MLMFFIKVNIIKQWFDSQVVLEGKLKASQQYKLYP